MDNFTVYSNPEEYAAFPSLAIDEDEVIYCVFRLAPTRRSKTHIDTRSVAMLYKSADRGETWEKVSQVEAPIYSGIQDPSLCIVDNQMLLNYFTWTCSKGHTKKLKNARMFGCFIRRSSDKERWDETFTLFAWNNLSVAVSEPPIVVDGRLLLPAYTDTGGGGNTCILISIDKSLQGEVKTIKIASDSTLDFQEPSLVDCRDGHLLCLMRVPSEDGSKIYQAHSWNNGESWELPRDTKMRGVPPNVIRLKNGLILCTYGYRKPPYGVRACFSKNEGLTWETHKEIIIRADGKGWDLGYPSTVQLKDGTLLTAYYFYTQDDKTRRIEVTRWKMN
jgi:sialidase-1